MSKKSAFDKFKVIQLYLEDKATLISIAKDSGISIRSLHRWIDQYKVHGLDGLKSKARNDKGCHRQLTENLAQVIEGLALQEPKRSVAAIIPKIMGCQYLAMPLFQRLLIISPLISSALRTKV